MKKKCCGVVYGWLIPFIVGLVGVLSFLKYGG